MSIDKKCSRLRQSCAKQIQKSYRSFLQQPKNDHYPIETTYNKNITAHTPTLSIITKISKFYPHSEVFCKTIL